MKNLSYKLALLALFVAPAGSLMAACGASSPVVSAVANFADSSTMPGTVGTNIINHVWQRGNPTENLEGCAERTTRFIIGTGSPTHYQWATSTALNWAAGCAGSACPYDASPSDTRTTTTLTSGDTNGSGRPYYFVASYHENTGTTTSANFTGANGISNGVATTNGVSACTSARSCIMAKALIPLPTIQTIGGGATYNHATGAGSVLVSFTLPYTTGDLSRNWRGYTNVATAVPADFVVYEVYQVNNSGTVPAVTAASWPGTAIGSFTAADCAGGGGTVCSKLITVNTINSAVNGCPIAPTPCTGFLAVRPFVDGAFRTDFLGVQSAGIAGPLAVQGLPTSVEIYPTKVNNAPGFQARWTSTNESEVASYKVMASRDGANWAVVADNIATKGAGTYTQSITRRTVVAKAGPATSFQIKVVVVKRDGTTQDAGPSTYTWTPRRGD